MPSSVASALFRNAASPMRAVLFGDVKFQKKIENALPIAAVRGWRIARPVPIRNTPRM